MQIQVTNTPDELAILAADRIEELVRHKPDCVLGFATGSTPLATYQELIRRYRAGRIDFSKVRTFNLDEYWGLPPSHPQSYHSFMQEHVFQHLNIPADQVHLPQGHGIDEETACRDYEQEIRRAGGIDLQVLGIGTNGHIGFNEPAKELRLDTHLVTLTQATVLANSRFFNSPSDVPRRAITMGVRTILSSRRLLLLATGPQKAAILQQLFQRGISTELPASLLHLHPDATILADQDAAALLA